MTLISSSFHVSIFIRTVRHFKLYGLEMCVCVYDIHICIYIFLGLHLYILKYI